jgi:hypothetical protein
MCVDDVAGNICLSLPRGRPTGYSRRLAKAKVIRLLPHAISALHLRSGGRGQGPPTARDTE